jgi:DNA-binding GntR family transcriptional regulator
MSEAVADVAAPITRLKRATFRAQIVDQLRDAIIRGDLAPGSPVTELSLARRFGVSRGPLREAMRQLEEQGFLVSAPYTGTRVAALSIDDVHEIYSLRTAMETLAFRQVWPRRDARFAAQLRERHAALARTLSAADSEASSRAEVALHSLVYETCGHRLLFDMWRRLAGRLQIYLALHQRAHGRTGPLGDAHDDYVRLALGDDLDAMLREVEHHMRRGVARLGAFLATADAGAPAA